MKSCSYKKNKLRQSDYFAWNLPSFLKFDFLGLILYLHYLFWFCFLKKAHLFYHEMQVKALLLTSFLTFIILELSGTA